jgi:hypothetical protein
MSHTVLVDEQPLLVEDDDEEQPLLVDEQPLLVEDDDEEHPQYSPLPEHPRYSPLLVEDDDETATTPGSALMVQQADFNQMKVCTYTDMCTH